MKPTDAENTIEKLKYPKHLRHLSIERLEILAKIFTSKRG
jgi:anti-sigma factor ChrR (cupin superfamily)